MEWYLKVWKDYATFNGRARRKEYWMFFLINFIVAVVLALLQLAFHVITFVALIYNLAILVPTFAVTARRLHDIGRSGWWQLIYLIPIVGTIILIVVLCQNSESGPNRFGGNPKLDHVA